MKTHQNAPAMSTSEQYDFLTKTPIPTLLLKLSIPSVFSLLITSIYNMADTFFVGQISTSASGAVGIVASLMTIIQAIGFTLGNGSGGVVSRKLGEQDSSAASRIVSTGFFAALGAGLLLGIFGLLFLEPFMYTLGSTDTILPHAMDYAFYILLAAPIMMSSLVLNNVLRYEGNANFAMLGLVSGGILNIILDPIFIFGCNMGTGGAGLATAVSQLAGWLILFSVYARGKTSCQISFKKITRSPAEFRVIFTTGMPSLGRQGLASIASMVLNLTARGYGDAAVAAMSIIARFAIFINSFVVGVGQGLQPIAAFNFGAKKFGRVYDATVTMIKATTVISLVLMAVLLSHPAEIMRIFRDDPEVIAIAVPAFIGQILTIPTLPMTTAGNMLFQSLGKAKVATFLACCRQGICFVIPILLFPRLWGIFGLQIAQPTSDFATFAISACLLLPYLKKLKALGDLDASQVHTDLASLEI
ncbi:MAG: MATE family efflux transporter [Faecalibacterium sp.]